MTNLYHILHKKPALTTRDMPKELEALAQALVHSGKLRVDADERVNFVRYNVPDMGVTMMFSHRELYEPELLKRTENILELTFRYKYGRNNLAPRIEEAIAYLRKNDKKYFAVEEAIELKLARLLVQATEPEVMKLILLEEVEVFVTYDHVVGGMLDIMSWQRAGDSSGLQSTYGKESAVFVACGGNPFAKVPKEDRDNTYGNGKPAMARLMVIAGQELGHFADIIRDNHGRKIGRHSANLSGTRAHPHIIKARHDDIDSLLRLDSQLNKLGLAKAVTLEKAVKFYKKHKKFSLRFLRSVIQSNRATYVLLKRTHRILPDLSAKFEREHHPAIMLRDAIDDMRFNLTPQAEAYRRQNPSEEEAILCVEALARIPQQVVKWGHHTTRIMMPSLYKVYYHKVIPACAVAGLAYNSPQ